MFSFAAQKRTRKAPVISMRGRDGLRHPASASCLGRHSHLAGCGPNGSSLYPPLAAVVAVANQGLPALDNPKAVGSTQKS